MKIAFVLPDLNLSGGVRVVATLSERLRALGHEVLVVAGAPPRYTVRERIRILRRERAWPRQPTQERQHFGSTAVEVIELPRGARLLDVPRLRGCDAVIATWWETAEWVAALPDDAGAKVYFVQHDETHFEQQLVRVRATYRLRMHKIAVSEWIARVMREEHGDPCVDVVQNCVDASRFGGPPRARGPAFTVGFMYSRSRFKASDVACAAVEQARRSLPALQVVAFGDAPPTRSLPLPPGTQFTLRPSPELLPRIYARADAWLFSSRSEGFGLPLLEAMASGTPVIGTPAGAAPELLGGGCGVLVPPEDPAAMAAAIVSTARMPPAEWQAMSERASARASARSWDTAAREFERALLHAIERARAGEIGGRRGAPPSAASARG